MSIYREVKIWKLTPEQIAAYKPGMDLGEPDRIEIVTALTKKDSGHGERIKRGMRKSKRRKKRVTFDEYMTYRRDGLTDVQIADVLEIQYETLKAYKLAWKKAQISGRFVNNLSKKSDGETGQDEDAEEE